MGGVFSRSKKTDKVAPEANKVQDAVPDNVPEIDTKLDLQEGDTASPTPPPLPERDLPVIVEHVTYSSCDTHTEIVTRKPTPYGKPSLESIRRVVSVTGSGSGSGSGSLLSVPNTSGGTSGGTSGSTGPNTSTITSVSHGGLEVCTSKEALTLSSDASTESSDSSSESSSE